MKRTMMIRILTGLLCAAAVFLVGCDGDTDVVDGAAGIMHVYRYDAASNSVIEYDIYYPDELTEDDYFTYAQAMVRVVPEPTTAPRRPTGGGGGGTPTPAPAPDLGGDGDTELPW